MLGIWSQMLYTIMKEVEIEQSICTNRMLMLGAERLYWDEVEDKLAEGVWGQVMGSL